ncbi:hypothetical protein LTR70_000092 [Exophiala xenobiotica]|uniref:Uncharacterized protein n=1 Tax=Lithohypha guttulata TaxID=1690604 RepID=A0ABR0KP29_9EURO|nr:hypothetical protein LTR24_000217 [Lithohypha guttulata]KAK5330770.1 hypothetical protein LTR70_000092 [Exophiala xenobiotica]
MLVASPILLAVLFFVSLSYAAPTTESKRIWTISVFRGPAPSPEDGPPASANALRDPSKLKYEAVGIVCAYLVWLVFTGIALLIVARRTSRKQQGPDPTPQREQKPNLSLQMETIKPTQVTVRDLQAGPKSPLTPKSPGKMASIRSWARRDKARQSQISVSTVNTRVDERVIENDRARNMDDMAKLYAAVMAHDQQRATHKPQSSTDSSPVSDDITPVTPKSPQCPPNLAHPAYLPPGSPIYSQPQAYTTQAQAQQEAYQQPQEYTQQHTYPQHHRQESYDPMPLPPMPMPTDNDRESLLDNQTSPRKGKPTALSLISNTASRLGSSHSSKARPSPITIRGQPISKPLGSADLRQSAISPSQASFKSGIYSPGPPPPTPGRTPAPVVEEFEMHGRPQLTSTGIGSDGMSTGNTSTKTLPFRHFYQDTMKSAPPTKTTFLDRRASAINGPKTGVPKTPYSPYCPTTPMTPVTPRRLLGKEELKKNKKAYALKVVKENEMVQSDTDMWGTD